MVFGVQTEIIKTPGISVSKIVALVKFIRRKEWEKADKLDDFETADK